MLLRDILPRMLLGEDDAAQYPAADDAGVGLLCDTLLRTLLVWGCCCVIKGARFWTPYFLHPNGCCCAIPCCGRCWVTMSLRNTLLGTMLVWGCCAIPCCGRCWCEDGAARYRAADGAGVRMVLRDAADGAGERMVLRDTVLWTVLVWGCCCAIKGSRFWTPYFLHLEGCCCAIPCCGCCWVRMLLLKTLPRMMLVWGCCAIPCCGRCWCEDAALNACCCAIRSADDAGWRQLRRALLLRTLLFEGVAAWYAGANKGSKISK